MIYEPCVILKPEMVEIASTARIDSFVKIEGGKGVKIGEYVHIASFSHINVGGGEVIFCDHSGCSSGVRVGAAHPDLSFLYASAAEPERFHHVKRYRTVIGAFAVLFMGAIILPGIEIGEGAVVSAGAVVYDHVRPWTIVAGNPARKIKERVITSRNGPLREDYHRQQLQER